MSGPWMTSTLASSVLTCVMGMAGVTMAIAGQTCNKLTTFFIPLSSTIPLVSVKICIKVRMNKNVQALTSLTGVMMDSLEQTASPPPHSPLAYFLTLSPRMHCSPHGKR